MINLEGKIILVTGASKGIGASIAKISGEAGATVIAHYRSDLAGAQAALNAVPDERKLFLQADLHDLNAVEGLWQNAVAWHGRVDVFVNNAAIMLWNGGINESDATWDAVWEETLLVNLLAPARLLRQSLKHFRSIGGGTLITISSWAAQRGVTNPATMAYAASKAAIRSVTQSIARGYARDKILAYIVAPGVVRTQMSESFAMTQGGEEAVTAGLAMGEWVPPDDIGNLVAFLASGTARHLSGATLDVNGASYIR